MPEKYSANSAEAVDCNASLVHSVIIHQTLKFFTQYLWKEKSSLQKQSEDYVVDLSRGYINKKKSVIGEISIIHGKWSLK